MVLYSYTEKNDILSNGTLDNLIRNKLITNEMATSLMNDSAYSYNISKNLITMAEIIFIHNDIQDITNNVAINYDDVKSILDKKET